jgi:hypothetical protein
MAVVARETASHRIVGQPERTSQRTQANRKELVERIAQVVQTDGTIQPLPGL